MTAVIHRPIGGAIRTVTITKNSGSQYYASVMFEDGKEMPTATTKGKAIGLDLGLTDFCITSDAQKFDNPRWFKKYIRPSSGGRKKSTTRQSAG